jgi:hypothetical protein
MLLVADIDRSLCVMGRSLNTKVTLNADEGWVLSFNPTYKLMGEIPFFAGAIPYWIATLHA